MPFSQTVTQLYLISSAIIILLLTASFTAVFSIAHYDGYAFHMKNLREQVYASKKRFIKNAVYRTIGEIDAERSRCATMATDPSKETVFSATCSQDQLENRIKDRIRNTRLIDDGYIWINAVVNYDGGDDYAIRLVHPNLVKTEGMFLSTKMKDIKGDTPYLTELNGIKKDGELFFTYWFKKKGSDKISQKLSFAKLYKDYDWIIATGVYLDDMEILIAEQQKLIRAVHIKELIKISIFGFLAALGSLLITRFYHRRIHGTIARYIQSADEKKKIITDMNTHLEERVKERTQEIETSRIRLQESEEKYRNLVELAQEGIWAIDSENITTFVNPSMAAMLGYTTEEMTGKPLFSFMSEQAIEIANQNIKRRKQGIREQHDFEFISKDGRRIFTTLETAPILDHDGNYQGSLAGVIDITEKKQLELRLQQSQKLESIGTLAGGIAHDFNNLLTSIIGFTELALETVEPGTPTESDLQEVYTAGHIAKELVKQILAFARQSGEEIKPVRVDTILREVLKLIRSSIPSTIDINLSISTHGLVMGNPSQIHQIIMNLCTNAAHAMENKGDSLNVSLSEIRVDDDPVWEELNLKHGPYIQIKVRDNGVGIPPEIIGSIFEPYFTTKGMGEGSGMGLAMVDGIVASYGGKINVSSCVGKGTIFKIFLPATREQDKAMEYSSPKSPRGTERILFVDDEEQVIRMGEKTLRRLGYTVTTTRSSIDALKQFQASPDQFDLVITDMTMPQITGDLLSEKLMAIRPDIPIIMFTGFSKKITEDMAQKIGIKAFVYKPMEVVNLSETVRAVLDGVINGP